MFQHISAKRIENLRYYSFHVLPMTPRCTEIHWTGPWHSHSVTTFLNWSNRSAFLSLDLKGTSREESTFLNISTLKAGSLFCRCKSQRSYVLYVIGCFNPIASTIFAIKFWCSALSTRHSISSSCSIENPTVPRSLRLEAARWEKKPCICVLVSHSVRLNHLSLERVVAVLISFSALTGSAVWPVCSPISIS